MGCGLGQMAIGLSLRSKKLDESRRPALNELMTRLGEHKTRLQNCVEEDSRSFDVFMAAVKLPKDNPERKARMQAALKHAAEVPLETARLAYEALSGLRVCASMVLPHVVSDYRSAGYLLQASIRCAAENVFINAESMEDRESAVRMVSEAKGYIAACVEQPA